MNTQKTYKSINQTINNFLNRLKMNNQITLTICTARNEGTGNFLSDNGMLEIIEGANYLCAYLDDEKFMIYEDGMFYSIDSIHFDF